MNGEPKYLERDDRGILLRMAQENQRRNLRRQELLQALRIPEIQQVSGGSQGLSAPDPNRWKPYNMGLEGGNVLAMLADALTTVSGLRQKGNVEGNPLYGKNPSPGRVWATSLGTGAAHAAGSYLLNEPYRTIYQILTLLGRGLVVRNNIKRGGRITL